MKRPLRRAVLAALVWLAADGTLARAGDAGPATTPDKEPAEAPWVVFRGPAFTGEGLPHGGPDWGFETPRLPVLAADARSMVVATSEIILGGTPNLSLEVLRVPDLSVLATLPILSVAEFRAAADAPTAAAAFAELAKRVEARIADATATLAMKRWIPLAACVVAPDADSNQPPCAVKEQQIACPTTTLRYAQRALSGTWKGRRLRWRSRDFQPGPVKDASYGAIPVRACFGAAWFEASTGVFLGQLRNECQRGGDACIVQMTWHAKVLR
jgi:hypothetical protein